MAIFRNLSRHKGSAQIVVLLQNYYPLNKKQNHETSLCGSPWTECSYLDLTSIWPHSARSQIQGQWLIVKQLLKYRVFKSVCV